MLKLCLLAPAPETDLRALKTRSAGHSYLLAPDGVADACDPPKDGTAPVFGVSAARLAEVVKAVMAEETNTVCKSDREEGGKRVSSYVCRTKLIGYPDLLMFEVIPVDDANATLAIYSRSVYGFGDWGVNKARVDRLVDLIGKRLTPA
ncbi:hypothetical protein FVE85_3641 [Porphyridium purpureum]|uniref:DUF1499 domain-containing protein n=1 Tax=Porphyridium purpureum TaxID=35688 RepID=A0A5J4YND3_PORPP|nr:hypothetical protein FVE85_3641 [Porphyridium purpureum]|eukprot:POR5612..scf249_10